MDFNTILLLTLAGLLFLMLLVVAGLTLSARVFTTLAELIRSVFLLVTQVREKNGSAPTASLPSQEVDTSSSQKDGVPSESEK